MSNKYINQFLTNNDNEKMNLNFSQNTEYVFINNFIECEIVRMLIYIEGDLLLTNGFKLWYKENQSSSKIFLNDSFIKDISILKNICYDYDENEKYFLGKIVFSKLNKYINLSQNGSIGISFNDNLSTLNDFNIVVQGYSNL